MLDERQETGVNTGNQSEQFLEPTIWDFIEENKDDKHIHLKITPGTEEHKMINFVYMHFSGISKTKITRLLIKAGFKVFLRTLAKQEVSDETK